MKVSKSVTKSLNKNKESSWDKATNAKILVLPLVLEEGEYNEDNPLQVGKFKLLMWTVALTPSRWGMPMKRNW